MTRASHTAGTLIMLTLTVLLVCLLPTWAQNEVCHPPCGCFSMDYPFDSWDPPESPDLQQLAWDLYVLSNPATPIRFDLNSTIPSEYDSSKPTKFIIHGWLGNATELDIIRDAFWDVLLDFNVVLLDWEGGQHDFYPQSAYNTRVAGACTGVVAERMVIGSGADWDDIHCIGHSLGAQVCGQMGLWAAGKVGRITGLDPAGPLFDDPDDIRIRLDKSDAQFQDNIHTNAASRISLGLGQPIGHADFFPNKGGPQPPCEIEGDIDCDTNISVDYWISSIVELLQCRFSAFPCDSDAEADLGLCERCDESIDCQVMGYYADTMPGNGSFYLRTEMFYPYCET